MPMIQDGLYRTEIPSKLGFPLWIGLRDSIAKENATVDLGGKSARTAMRTQPRDRSDQS